MRAGLFAAVALFAAACGFVPPPTLDGGTGSGRTCLQDSECVPDACCGRGQNAVHVDEAPDCTAVDCDGTCPDAQLRCGCAIPVCRDQHCSVAVTTGPGCP